MTRQQKALLEGLLWAAISGITAGSYTTYIAPDGKVRWGVVAIAALSGIGLFARGNAKLAPTECPSCGGAGAGAMTVNYSATPIVLEPGQRADVIASTVETLTADIAKRRGPLVDAIRNASKDA